MLGGGARGQCLGHHRFCLISRRLVDGWLLYSGYWFSVTQKMTWNYVCRSVTYISWWFCLISVRLFSDCESLPISAYSGLLKFDMKMFVNIARLHIRQLFTQRARRGHPCTLDTFLVLTEIKMLCKVWVFYLRRYNFCEINLHFILTIQS